jgi:hypothetical protein
VLSAVKTCPFEPTCSLAAALFPVATRISPLFSQSIFEIREP